MTRLALRSGIAIAAIGLVFSDPGRARANVVFSQNFDTGSASYTTNDPYWLDNSLANGYIVKDTTTAFGGLFNNLIPQDASGTGYFLFTGTAGYPGAGNIPPGQDQFFISPTFSVTPNTNYVVSFALTNAIGFNFSQVSPEIDGSVLGSPSSAAGTYSSNGWQNFTYTWNSGNNTTASLILHDLTTTPTGNDFGLDNIL